MMLNKCLIVSKLLLITCVLLFRMRICCTFVINDAEGYLQRFGYLAESSDGSANLVDGTIFRDAIKRLQKNANIPTTGVIDDATKAVMKRPRCGRPDNESSSVSGHRQRRYVIEGHKWPHTNLTWSFVNRTMTKLDVGRVRQVLKAALDIWQRGSNLRFREVHDPNADIQVLFVGGKHGDRRDFDGPSGVLAHAFYPAPGRGGDAHFDDEEDWSLESGHGTSLMDVAVHEFGHSIGLGHSSVRGSIMYAFFFGEQYYTALTDDDRIAVQQLYGTTENEYWGLINPRPTIKSTTKTTTTTTTTTTTKPRSYYPERSKSLDENQRIAEEKERQRRIKDREKIEQQRIKQQQHQDWLKQQQHQDWLKQQQEKQNPPTKSTTTKYPYRHRYLLDEPDTCNTTYDAVTMFRGEMFIFKNRYLWRIGNKGLYPDSPREIAQFWKISDRFTHVDAAYENKNGRMILFVGRLMYSFNGHDLDRGYPKLLHSLGLPYKLPKIDDVMVWGFNNITYFFSGTEYWRFDEDTNIVDKDYPRDIHNFWKSVPYHMDAAFKYKDGKTYFFKGKSYWQFDDLATRVTSKKPESSALKWMGCRPPRNTLSNEVDIDVETHHERHTGLSSASNAFVQFWISIPCLIFVKLLT